MRLLHIPTAQTFILHGSYDKNFSFVDDRRVLYAYLNEPSEEPTLYMSSNNCISDEDLRYCHHNLTNILYGRRYEFIVLDGVE